MTLELQPPVEKPLKRKRLHEGDDIGIELALTAIILCPTLDEAAEVVKQHGYSVSRAKLEVWANGGGGYMMKERMAERRKDLAPKLEGRLADNLLDSARLTTEVMQQAIACTSRMLDEGRCADPAKVARDLSQVVSQNIEKRLSLEGRPDKIVEKRDHTEILRALEAMKVVQVVDSTAEEDEGE